jgi:hypothetical protein
MDPEYADWRSVLLALDRDEDGLDHATDLAFTILLDRAVQTL